MRILIWSDIHVEHWGYTPEFNKEATRPDIVVIAGDADTNVYMVEECSKIFGNVPVLYVHGNHEAYNKTLEGMLKDWKIAASNTKNVKFLDRDEFIYRNVRFLGCCLWTDFNLFGIEQKQLALDEANRFMSDYHYIKLESKGYKLLTAQDTMQLHAVQREWLAQKLREPFDGPTVVVTHMAPSMQSVQPQYQEHWATAAFASELPELLSKTTLWFHGHMHASADYTAHGCRVVCNPRGYRTPGATPENPNWDPNFIVELPVPATKKKLKEKT